LRIALYYPWIYLKSGIERIIYQTISRSRHDWQIFTSHYDNKNTYPELNKLDVIKIGEVSVNRTFLDTIKSIITISRLKIDETKYDAILVHSEGLGNFFTLNHKKIPIICYCHTPVRSIYDDIYVKKYLENYPKNKIPLKIFSKIYKYFDKICWPKYEKVFVNSNEVMGRLLKNKLVDSKKVEILNPGIEYDNSSFSTFNEKYFLVAGRIMWTKNIELAIDSFKSFSKERSGYRLIIAGIVDKKSNSYLKYLMEVCDNNHNIEFIINPTDLDLLNLYKKCTALLFTPLNEDFGMVPLEAMSFGKPVIAVNCGGPKETIIDRKTGYLVDPNTIDFKNKMLLITGKHELYNYLCQQSFMHVEKYDWSNFVQRLDNYIDSLKNIN